MTGTELDAGQMPMLEGVIYIPDFSLVASRSEKLAYAREHLNELFGQKYPKYFHREHVSYYHDEAEDLALINYTSGTTGFSKGVMLPYRTLWSNLDAMTESLIEGNIKRGSNVLSILPMAHMYGMMVEFIIEFCYGNHIFFLTRLPSPSFIAEAFAELHPAVVISVPLVVEKIVRKNIFPVVQSNRMKLLLNMPLIVS